MALPNPPNITAEEYLAFERASEEKHEFFGGRIFAMTGASAAHNLIAGNTYAELRGQLRGTPCIAYPGDLRVKVRDSGLYTYPDVSVACGERSFEDDQLDTLLNPVLLVEVLSSSTEAYDRGAKFVMYRALPSLREYVLIAQDRMLVEQYARQGDQWMLTTYSDAEAELVLAAVPARISLTQIYERVELSDVPLR